ncbi:MAG: thiamine phosphate synthase [Acidobacteria bacterium]|nr:thiamine phosphate synthase [Acidobacteriota bacterium]
MQRPRTRTITKGLPRLYALTDTRLAGGSHVEQAQWLIEAGVEWIQLREKRRSPKEFIEQVRIVLIMARSAGTRIIVNDRVDIALAAQADGVHLGQQDMDPAFARRLLGPERLIGYSTHGLDQALKADALPVDYVAVGPIFPTSTKGELVAGIGLEALRETCLRVKKPVVAIGGITLDRAVETIRAGAQSVAVVSDLLMRGDIRTRARAFLALLRDECGDHPT